MRLLALFVLAGRRSSPLPGPCSNPAFLSRRILLASSLLLLQTAIAQAQDFTPELLIFDPVPLRIEAPAVDVGSAAASILPSDAAAATQAAGRPDNQPPYQATELLPLPRTNPLPVKAALEQQTLRLLGNADRVSAEDIARAEASLKQLEQAGNAYANALPEVLMDLATAYESTGDFLKAQSYLDRANHLTRVNSGLFSLDQVPVVQRIFKNALVRGDLLAADQQQEYLYFLLLKAYGKGSAELIAPLQEYARWNMQAFKTYAPAALPVAPLSGTDALTDTPVAEVPAATVMDMAQFRIQHLINAQFIYKQLIDLLLTHAGNADPRLAEAQRLLAVNSYLFATQSLANESVLNESLQGAYYDGSQSLHLAGFSDGRKALERRIETLQQNDSTTPTELARSRLELVDWMIATRTRADFANIFTAAYEQYSAAGAHADELTALFDPPLPPEVPTFMVYPNTRQAFDLATDVALQYRGFIDVEYGLSRIGESQSPKILYVTPDTPEPLTAILLRAIRRGQFRPRMRDGELVANDKITARYYYTY
jgi:hypothetical protein